MQQQSDDALFAWQLTDIARKMYVLISIGNNRFYLSQKQLLIVTVKDKSARQAIISNLELS